MITIIEAIKNQSTQYIKTEQATKPSYVDIQAQDNIDDESLLHIFYQLVSARHKANLTQAEIAKKMGTTASAIARLEAGGGKKHHSPSLRTLKLYATALKREIKVKLV